MIPVFFLVSWVSWVAAETARLVGQDVVVAPDGRGYTIRDVAGEGAPIVGVVERRGEELWLVGDGAVRLVGKLAHPRIAGPGYKVWILGETRDDGLHVRRLGVLRPPSPSGRGAQKLAVTPADPMR